MASQGGIAPGPLDAYHNLKDWEEISDGAQSVNMRVGDGLIIFSFEDSLDKIVRVFKAELDDETTARDFLRWNGKAMEPVSGSLFPGDAIYWKPRWDFWVSQNTHEHPVQFWLERTKANLSRSLDKLLAPDEQQKLGPERGGPRQGLAGATSIQAQ